MSATLERTDRLAGIADALASHAKNAAELTARMAEVGIFTNTLEASFVGATVAGDVVGNLLDALLLSRANGGETLTELDGL